jgi:hypothetical protein
MQGTIVCGVTDTDEGRQALATAVELTERLRLRLVLAHVAEGIGPLNGDGDGGESVTMKGGREGAARPARGRVRGDGPRRAARGRR